ncbi:MAG: sigma-54 dependent transcriptional regulator [Betaproteobacteria bacterium]|nr:sigma-54 dependent transcriptional regulator [Betaproteobacteria bacterium]
MSRKPKAPVSEGEETALPRRVLVVDDEADIRELLALTLERMGLAADTAASAFEAEQHLRKQIYDLCLTDMRLPDGDGLGLLEHVTKNYPGTPVAVITAYGSAENAVAALKAGAFDYLSKPVSLAQLRPLVNSALKLSKAGQPKKTGECVGAGHPVLLGDSQPMQQTRQMIEKLARSQAPIHITGESGSGKELAARLIHLHGPRGDGPFVAVNCGAIPENLMESEFFGYKKGAFTGAAQDKDGFFHTANSGTLFLDEVADLPLQMQVKLLRVIQEKMVRKVGDTQEDPVDVRIISATHQDLGLCVEQGKFRQDLYYRLNVIILKMPALREIPDDIPLLAGEILGKMAGRDAVPPKLSPEALKVLQEYSFPGNVRELENILERAMALTTGGRIGKADLHLTSKLQKEEKAAVRPGSLPLQEYLDTMEKEAIMSALEKSRYNKTAAAKLLGITFRALRYRLERLGID